MAPFWTGNAGGSVAEPKRAYKFVARFGVNPSGQAIEDLSMQEWVIKRVAKPSFSITETAHQFLNWTFYYPGRVEWNTIDVTLVDPIYPDTAVTLMNHLEQHGWVNPNNWSPRAGTPDVSRTVSKDKGSAGIGKFTIQQLNSAGAPIEEWALKNPFMTNVTFGDLAYDSEELNEITMTVRFDWAELKSFQHQQPTLRSMT